MSLLRGYDCTVIMHTAMHVVCPCHLQQYPFKCWQALPEHYQFLTSIMSHAVCNLDIAVPYIFRTTA